MLSVQAQPTAAIPTEPNDSVMGALVNSLEAIMAPIIAMTERRTRILRSQPPAVQISSTDYWNTERTRFTNVLKYKRNNTIFEFEIPIFFDLQGYDVSRLQPVPLEAHQPQAETRTRSYFDKFKDVVYQPLIMIAAGFTSVVNVINLLPISRIRMLMPRLLAEVSLPFKLFALAGSALYFVPFIAGRVRNNFLAFIQDALNDINNQNHVAAREKFRNISKIYRILLWYLPEQRDLKWSYYYVFGLACNLDQTSFENALNYSETDDQKFSCLYHLLNNAENMSRIYKKKLKSLYLGSSEEDRLFWQHSVEYFERKMPEYADQ